MTATRDLFVDKEFLAAGATNGSVDTNLMTFALIEKVLKGHGTAANTVHFSGAPEGDVTDIVQKFLNEGMVSIYNYWRHVDGALKPDRHILIHPQYPSMVMVDYYQWSNSLNFTVVADNTYDSDGSFFQKLAAIASASVNTKPKASISMVATSSGGPVLQTIGRSDVPFEPSNYAHGVRSDFEHVVADLKTKKPCGRVTIFDGEPGTGKTYLVRALTGLAPECRYVIVPTEMVAQLTTPSFVPLLASYRTSKDDMPLVLIIEDADACLVSRGGDNIGSISALLNLSEGILGAMLDIRVIATTNAGHISDRAESVDSAIMRAGRLCRRIHVGKLGRAQCESLYERLTGKQRHFSSEMTLAEIYRLANDSSYEAPVSAPRLGFGI